MSAVLFGACLCTADPGAARSVTDSAGRVVEVPDRVSRVFAAGPPAAVLLYVLKPEALIGWPRAIRETEQPFLAAPYAGLPETGRLTGRGGEANLEVVLKAAPDLIVDFGSLRETYVSLAERVQAQTGIPYVLIDGRFENTAEALRLFGEILGVPARGEALAAYAEASFGLLDDALADLPEAGRPGVYLARGPDGLETGTRGSINTEIIERAGGRNVIGAGEGRRGLTEISLEQVIVAAPEIVVTWDRGFFEAVGRDPAWAGIPAVRDGRVHLSPSLPFGWIDRPPSLNRLIGLRWLASVFYPERLALDLPAETRAFYRLFYHVELSEAQLQQLIEWTDGQPR